MLSDICHLMTVEEVAYHFHLSEKNKFLFVETPKVACSSLKGILQAFELENKWYRPDIYKIHDRQLSPLLNPWQINDFDVFMRSPNVVKFCFVRDPVTRVLSSYLDKIVGNKEQKDDVVYTLYPGQPRETYVSFREFLYYIAAKPKLELDPHWRPQFLQNLCDFVNYDFIGKVEKFEKEMKRLDKVFLGKLHPYLRVISPHRTDANQKIWNYYDKELLELVEDVYRMDFRYFGYTLPSKRISYWLR